MECFVGFWSSEARKLMCLTQAHYKEDYINLDSTTFFITSKHYYFSLPIIKRLFHWILPTHFQREAQKYGNNIITQIKLEFKVHPSISWLPFFSLWTLHQPYKSVEPLSSLPLSAVSPNDYGEKWNYFQLEMAFWTQGNISYFYLALHKRNCQR